MPGVGSNYIKICRSMLKDTMNCLQKQKFSFPQQLQSGMQNFMSRWMMMFMLIWVCTGS